MLNDLVEPAKRGTARFPIYKAPDARWPSGIEDVKGLPDHLQAKLTLANLTYNFDRLIFHERSAATG